MQVKISIVIPVYNCEAYLKECLESVLTQTFSEIEVICVDDCSTDKSGEILSEYAKRDKRIKTIHNIHSLRAGGSRNRGLEAATGEYVMFLDGDDFFEPDMLKTCYQSVKNTGAQFVSFYYDMYDNERRVFSPGAFQETLSPLLISGYPVLDDPSKFPYLFQITLNGPYTRLIERDWLIHEGIVFPDLENIEDLSFSYSVFAAAQRIAFVDRRFVHYRKAGQGGLTDMSFQKKNCIVAAYREAYLFLQSKKLFSNLERSFGNEMVRKLLEYFENKRTGQVVWDQIKKEFYQFYQEELSCLNWTKDFFYNPVVYQFYRYLIGESKRQDEWNLYKGCSRYRQISDYAKKNGYTLALWGAGERGEHFLEAYRMQGGTIDFIIDSDEKKAGKDFFGYCVSPYREVAERVDAIIITNPFWQKDIISEVQGRAKILINIYPFVEYNCDLRDIIIHLS